jgi:hypothetical protein
MNDILDEQSLYRRIADIIAAARSHVSRSVNTAMVHTYWFVGREIIQVEQAGSERADYGEALLKRLASRLSAEFGSGFSMTNLKRMRQFYLQFPTGSAVPQTGIESATLGNTGTSEELEKSPTASDLFKPDRPLFPAMLSWSHYVALIRVANPHARTFYEIEAARQGWAVRELDRQIASLLFERISRSRDQEV